MGRIQFIELHEQPWLPTSVRDDITDALQFGLNVFKAYAPVAPVLQKALDSTRSYSVADLCSGGGGPWLDLFPRLREDTRAILHIGLTDKFPNFSAYQDARAALENHISFYPDPVDAMDVPRALKGFRTMFTSLHHFQPEQVRTILQDAVDAGEGIGIFEVTRRAPGSIALMFLWALTPIVFTPLMRPFRWSRLLWTYVIPVIPFVLLFDGVVSCMRTYTPQELREIIASLETSRYQWEVDEHSSESSRVPISYVIGRPRTEA